MIRLLPYRSCLRQRHARLVMLTPQAHILSEGTGIAAIPSAYRISAAGNIAGLSRATRFPSKAPYMSERTASIDWKERNGSQESNVWPRDGAKSHLRQLRRLGCPDNAHEADSQSGQPPYVESPIPAQHADATAPCELIATPTSPGSFLREVTEA